MGDGFSPFLIGLVFAAGAGFAAAWFLFRLGERSRHEALEAQCREEVKAAGVARDRNQARAVEFESRLDDVREEHAHCAERIQDLEIALEETRTTDLRQTVKGLRSQLKDRDAAIVRLESRIAENESDLSALREQLDTAQSASELAAEELLASAATTTALEREAAAAREEHAGCAERIQTLEARLSEADGRYATLERQTRDLEEGHDTAMAALRKQLTDGATQLDQRAQRVAALEADLAKRKQALAAGDSKARSLEARVADLSRLEPLIGERDAKIASLDSELEQARALHNAADTQAAGLTQQLEKAAANTAGLEEELSMRSRRIQELEADVRERDETLAIGKPTWLLASPEGEPNPLQELSGIGAIFEARLNELGVFHFSQLAQLSAVETAWLSLRLNTTPARIEREDWPAQAKRKMSKASKTASKTAKKKTSKKKTRRTGRR